MIHSPLHHSEPDGESMKVATQLNTFLRYGFAAGSAILALLLTIGLPSLFEQAPPLIFLVAVVISALYGGWGPGLLSLCLSVTALGYSFMFATGEAAGIPVKQFAGLSLFVMSALLLAAFSLAHRRSEAALREKQDQLTQSQALAHLGSYTLSIPDAHNLHWSDETFRIVGLDPAGRELHPGKTIERLVHPADQSHVAEVLRQCVRHAEPFDLEYRVQQSDGDTRWVQSIVSPVTNGNGTVIKLIGTLGDITARKRTEEALQQSEARLRSTLDNLLEGYQIIGFDWTYLYMNEAAGRHGRRTMNEFLGRSMMEMYPATENQELFARLRRCMDERAPAMLEHELCFHDGARRLFVLSIQPVPEGLFILSHDITDRKRAKEALRESEACYRAIVEGQTELICRFRPDTVLTFVNQAYCRYFEKRPEEVVGRSVLSLLPMSQREHMRSHIASLQSHPRVAGCEHEVIAGGGERRWLEWTDRAITDDEGCVTEIQSIGRDITERKQAEITLRRLSGRLLQLQDEERRRIARELHDSTAQSLAALSMNLTVVETNAGTLSEEARKALGESLALAKHSTRELRTLSYLLHPPLLDESGLISALRWYVDGFSKRSGIQVDLDVPPQACRFPTELETALFRIMQECLTNTLKHSGSATATIRVALEESRVIMEIGDQGKGMPASVKGHDGDRVSGLGVGLMGMRERVRQLHGELGIESGDWGTAVTVTLPLDGGERWARFAS
jgi:PAS domain S-box-containing protein